MPKKKKQDEEFDEEDEFEYDDEEEEESEDEEDEEEEIEEDTRQRKKKTRNKVDEWVLLTQPEKAVYKNTRTDEEIDMGPEALRRILNLVSEIARNVR